MSISNQNIIRLKWDDISNICKKFCSANTDNFDCIVAVTRGGLVPAIIISHLKNIRLLYPFQIYETENDIINSKKNVPKFGENIDFNCIIGKKILLIDDIFGSGATLHYVNRFLSQFTKDIFSFVCVQNVNNYNHKYRLPKYIGRKVSGWVVFPWEVEKYER